MNRVRKGQDLFVDQADYQQFFDLLQETTECKLFEKRLIGQPSN